MEISLLQAADSYWASHAISDERVRRGVGQTFGPVSRLSPLAAYTHSRGKGVAVDRASTYRPRHEKASECPITAFTSTRPMRPGLWPKEKDVTEEEGASGRVWCNGELMIGGLDA
jgi:hypothetical protein